MPVVKKLLPTRAVPIRDRSAEAGQDDPPKYGASDMIEAKMPSPFMKNLPTYLKAIGLALIAIGGWWTDNVLTDTAMVETYGWVVKVPPILTLVAGFITTLAGIPVSMSNDRKTEIVVNEQKSVVEDAQDEVIAVKDEPPDAPPGEDPVCYTLLSAAMQATQVKRFAHTKMITDLITAIDNEGSAEVAEEEEGGAA